MDNVTELKGRMDDLRKRSADAANAEALQVLLDEARLLLQAAFQTELEEEARNLFRQLRDQKDSLAVPAAPPSGQPKRPPTVVAASSAGLSSVPGETTPSAASPFQPGSGNSERLAQARRLFYAGDYYEAADAFIEILKLDPENGEARARLAQVEDNLKRGIVPDSRVPYEARVAFGRAQSLERAGRFEEAGEAYRMALLEARKGGRLLENWQPPVEALVRVDTSIIARETRDEADSLLRADQWREAVEKYEIVLKLLPDDGQARDRLNQLRKLQEQSEALRAQLKAMTSDLGDVASALLELRQMVADLRPRMTDSQRLGDLDQEINAESQTLKERIVERGQHLLSHARFVSNVPECRQSLSEAARLLDLARQLAPDDVTVFGLAQGAHGELNRLERAESSLDEAQRLVHLNTDAARRQANDLLRSLQDFVHDPRYVQLITILRRQHLDEVESALRQGHLQVAEGGLADAEDALFDALSPSDDVLKLDRQLTAARRAPWLRLLAWGTGMAVILLILGTLARPWALSILTSAAAAEPTLAAIPTEPATPTAVPTFTGTPTVEPTKTALPTLTLTPPPPATPTEAPRFGAIGRNSAAHLSADALSPWAFTLRVGDIVQIVDEAADTQGLLWYKILYMRSDSRLIGWAPADDINLPPSPAP